MCFLRLMACYPSHFSVTSGQWRSYTRAHTAQALVNNVHALVNYAYANLMRRCACANRLYD